MRTIIRIVALALCALPGCSWSLMPNYAPDSPKPPATPAPTASQRESWELMTGKWFGSLPAKDGTVRQWIVSRSADGTYEIVFRSYDRSGKYGESTEFGEWGVVGPIYFTVLKGWERGGELTPADAGDPSGRNAYRIIWLDRKEFTYESFSSGNRFKVVRVSDDFTFPAAPEARLAAVAAVAKQVSLVPGAGLEPAQAEARGILSPVCLPIPPSRRNVFP